MKKQKQIYVSPETETLVVRFEGVVCSSGFNATNSRYKTEYFDDDDDYTEL